MCWTLTDARTARTCTNSQRVAFLKPNCKKSSKRHSSCMMQIKMDIVTATKPKKLLNDACAELGAPAITDEQLDEVIKTVDGNGDGLLSFDELFKVIGPILEQQMR